MPYQHMLRSLIWFPYLYSFRIGRSALNSGLSGFFLRKHKEESYEEVPDSYKQDGDQLKNLLEEERQVVLEKCMNELRPDYKEYISYWFRHAGDEAAAVAKHFKISVNNAWTKKHRIIKMLKECCRKKLTI